MAPVAGGISNAEEVLNNLKRVAQSRKGKSLNQEKIDAMISQLKQSFDSEYGGFGNAPKFPYPQNLTQPASVGGGWKTFSHICWKRASFIRPMNHQKLSGQVPISLP